MYTKKERTSHKSFVEYSQHKKSTMERQRSEHTLAKVYGEQNEKLLSYEREKELIRKRDETKAELKALLKRYISQHNNSGNERGKVNACA